MLNEVPAQILAIISSKPGVRAKEIAAAIGVDRKVVNSALYGPLKGRVRQDNTYRWWMSDSFRDGSSSTSVKEAKTSLSKLCKYYLDCLSHDDLGGVSEFAYSSYGDLNYAELGYLPMLDGSRKDVIYGEQGQRLLDKVRRDKNRQTIYLGYPIRLRLLRSRKGWEGYMVEPILLFPFEDGVDRQNTPVLSNESPLINFKALRTLGDAGESGVMEEAMQLSEELGLYSNDSEQPDIEELIARLRKIRPDWDWEEEIQPSKLTSEPLLSLMNRQGIFNRAILIAAERSPFTKGLEYELDQLQSVDERNYQETALGSWINSRTVESVLGDQKPLLEVLPLNSEQRQAVRQALSNPLTVITGPPGTGKSQVVTSILVNAAWQGKTVLFASKNNKAIDVVETRVNSLGPRPILLRLGANQNQATLSEYLVSLLSAQTTNDDDAQYREFQECHTKLREKSDSLDSQTNDLIELRNEVDSLEQRTDEVRISLGLEGFARLKSLDIGKVTALSKALLATIDRSVKSSQPLLFRMFWKLVRQDRFTALNRCRQDFLQTSQDLSLPMPPELGEEDQVSNWATYAETLKLRISAIAPAKKYFEKLNALSSSASLEELAKQRKDITAQLSRNSASLWKVWLRLQPSRLTPPQRRLLGDYSALLQLIASANDQNQNLGRDVFRRYYELFPKITSILSCWAVTSLSARGRIPLEPNFFDLLVIDEASQCDIASALPLLYRARQVVVIGDPKQLRHISVLPAQQDRQLLSKHELVDSFARWAFSTHSLFDLASSQCRAEDIISLRDHHRSHADIIEFSNATFYEGSLRVATNYDRLIRPQVSETAVRWIDVRGKATRPGNGGALNETEAKAVITELEHLLRQGYRGSIGVVSPFRAQANRIRDIAYAREDLAARLSETNFLVDTVHKFQGDERDVMIFSPVVAEGISSGALGFLRSNPNLFNVAITRARASLVVVGDRSAALNCEVDYLARFASYTEEVGRIRPSAVNPILDLGSVYPAVASPELVSDWERIFYCVLYRSGIRSIPQYSVEKYLLDFAICEDERRLNIEIDGERYHRNWDGELCRRDQIRNQRLMELGWDIMRFWVYQVRDDLEECVRRVHSWKNKQVER